MAGLSKQQRIEKKINDLQSNLFDLYRQRQALFNETTDFSSTLRATTSEPALIAEQWYDTLAAEWRTRGLAIPAKSRFLPKIKSALITIEQLGQYLSVESSLFTLVAIPPTSQWSSSALQAARLEQSHINYNDQIDTVFKTPQTKKWRLLVVYDALEGIDFGSAANILADNRHIVHGMDITALGVHEYAVYALQHTGKRDATTWTWLLKDATQDAWSVRYMTGAYRFSLDDAAGVADGELFRPAVEIL